MMRSHVVGSIVSSGPELVKGDLCSEQLVDGVGHPLSTIDAGTSQRTGFRAKKTSYRPKNGVPETVFEPFGGAAGAA